MRKAALHEALSGTERWAIDWGTVDDVKSHELAHIIVTFVTDPQVHAAVAHAASWVALEASKAAIGAVATEAVKKLLDRLIPKQKEGKILNFWINVPAGRSVFVDREGEVTVGPTPPEWPED